MLTPELTQRLHDLRRQVLLVEKTIERFGDQPLSLSLRFDRDRGGTSRLGGPEEKPLTEFIMAARPILDRGSDVCLSDILHQLTEERCVNRPASIFSRASDAPLQSSASVVFDIDNTSKHGARDLYDIIAEGYVFSSNQERVAGMQPVMESFVGHVVLFQFYSFHLDAYHLARKVIRRSISLCLFIPEEPIGGPCLFCGREDQPSTAPEHIFPESLGNTKLVLPPGNVCDPCNHGPLSERDNYLLNWPPLAFLRVAYTWLTREGKMPTANFQNMRIERTGPRSIRIVAKDKSGTMRELEELEDGQFRFNMTARGGRLDPELLARSLFKIAVGCAAFDLGREAVIDRYPEARRFVLTGEGYKGAFFIRQRMVPNEQVRIRYQETPMGTPVLVEIFGLAFAFDLKPNTIQSVPQMTEQGFASYFLNEDA